MEWVELGRIGSPYGVLGWMHIQFFRNFQHLATKLRDGSASPNQAIARVAP